MQKIHRYGLIVGIVLIFSMLGTSAASARTKGYQEKLAFSVLNSGGLYATKMDRESDFTYLGSQFVREDNCFRPKDCVKWTGRWMITYLRISEGHWVTRCQLYVPEFIDNELDARNWRWSSEYIAKTCSLPDEPQTWEGIYFNFQQEMVPIDCKLICPVPVVDPPSLY
jgi:hypothetical protein